jgi:hypothetical protein
MLRTTFLKTAKLALALMICLNVSNAHAQNALTQTVRGTIQDSDLKSPLIGATIIVEGINPIMGTTTDLDGNFRLESVPVGRHNFKITYVGYEPFTLSEILLCQGKSLCLKSS